MARTMTGFATAVFMTALDVGVTWDCGPAIWQAWGNIPFTRLGMQLFAGVGMFTLMDIWARTFDIRRNRTTRGELGHVQDPDPIGAELMERADV